MLAVRRSTLEPLLAFLQNQDIDGIPESFYVMVNELKSLGLDVDVNYAGDEMKKNILGEEETALTVRGEDVLE